MKQIEIIKSAKAGDEAAIMLLIEANRKTIYEMAFAYKEKCLHLQMEKEDLVQEGMIGVLDAIEAFDVTKGTSFKTYAKIHIKKAMACAVRKKGFIRRIPDSIISLKGKIQKFENAYFNTNGVYPSTKVISENMRIDEKHIVEIKLHAKQYAESFNRVISSINEDITFEDCIPDKSTKVPEEDFQHKEMLQNIEAAIDSLDEKEKIVIRKMFGFDGDNNIRVKSIGEEWGNSRQSVYKILLSGLKKLAIQLEEYRHSV